MAACLQKRSASASWVGGGKPGACSSMTSGSFESGQSKPIDMLVSCCVNARTAPLQLHLAVCQCLAPDAKPAVADHNDPNQSIRIVLSQLAILVAIDVRRKRRPHALAWMRVHPHRQMG